MAFNTPDINQSSRVTIYGYLLIDEVHWTLRDNLYGKQTNL